MVGDINPLAAHTLPAFIVAPGESDPLLIGSAIFLLIVVILVGSFYFVLHSLPERMSHKTNRIQMEFVAVLALISLFTHNHLLWIFALLLAFVRIPDFETPIYAIAEALQRMVGGPVTTSLSDEPVVIGHDTPLPPHDPAPQTLASEVVPPLPPSDVKGV